MKTFKNKNLIFTLSLLVIFTFSATAFIVPAKADAQYYVPLGGGINTTYGFGGGSNSNQNNNSSITPVNNPAPVIYSISPTSAYKCSGATDITIVGKNFIPSSVAKWNGSGRVTTYLNSTHLVMQANGTDICGLGNYLVTVDNGTSGGLSNGAYFTVKTAQVSSVVSPSFSSQSAAPKPKATTPKTVTPKTATVAKTDSCETDNDKNSLAAGAIFGSDGFMPGNLMQWLLLAIMILVAVILWRKTVNRKEKALKYA